MRNDVRQIQKLAIDGRAVEALPLVEIHEHHEDKDADQDHCRTAAQSV